MRRLPGDVPVNVQRHGRDGRHWRMGDAGSDLLLPAGSCAEHEHGYQDLCSETFAQRVESLNPNHISLLTDLDSRFMKTVYRSSAERTEKQFDFKFRFSANDHNLTLTYVINGAIEEKDNFFVIFRNHMEHLHIHKSGNNEYSFESYGLEPDETFNIDETLDSFTIRFNFSHVPRDNILYSVIAVEKFVDGNRFQTIVPVVIHGDY